MSAGLPKFPAPPPVDALVERAPITASDRHALTPRDLLWRVQRTTGVHVTAWNELRRFGPTDARFDPHPPPPADHPGCGVLYLANSALAALAEAFQLRRAIDRHTGTPYLVGFRLTRGVRLLDLGGSWPTRAGASQEVNSGPRSRARAWARAVRAGRPELDGVSYPSSMCGGLRCHALWEPAADALPDRPTISMPLDNADLLGPLKAAADDLGYRLW